MRRLNRDTAISEQNRVTILSFLESGEARGLSIARVVKYGNHLIVVGRLCVKSFDSMNTDDVRQLLFIFGCWLNERSMNKWSVDMPLSAPRQSSILFGFHQESVLSSVKGDAYWETYLAKLFTEDSPGIGLHLAVLIEPYLGFLLKGLKTIESRFSTTRSPPYGRVTSGDVVLLKQSGGPIVGICEIENAWFYRLDTKSWRSIMKEFEIELGVQDPTFWEDRKDAEYATLMKVCKVRSIEPIEVSKKDRRGWVILRQNSRQLKLETSD
jgi:hypothetical protein